MKTILVALDTSPNATNVLAGARELAEKTQSKLILPTCIRSHLMQ